MPFCCGEKEFINFENFRLIIERYLENKNYFEIVKDDVVSYIIESELTSNKYLKIEVSINSAKE